MKTQQEIFHFAMESLGLSQANEAELLPFEGRGSDRTYFRFKWNHGDSVIIAHYELGRPENAYYADIATFLLGIDVPVPKIIRHDPTDRFIVMTDLGDVDLWSLRNKPWGVRRKYYQKTLAIAHRLHSFPERLFPSGRVKLVEAFGPGLYRWERNYFLDNFVERFCKIDLQPSFRHALETELTGLAKRLESAGRCLVHRDLQSQNVMICREEPFLIDFQGMRFGTCFYDLGSLLCDPYVKLSGGEREELLSYYYSLSEKYLDWSSFQNVFWEASAQRLMQALGAYGFLGIVKGLKNYMEHIPAGLRNLRTAAESAASLPHLLELSARCEKTLDNRPASAV